MLQPVKTVPPLRLSWRWTAPFYTLTASFAWFPSDKSIQYYESAFKNADYSIVRAHVQSEAIQNSSVENITAW